MRIHRHFTTIPQSAVALGTFDGVHKAHKAVLRLASTEAERLGLCAAAVVLQPKQPRDVIMTDSLCNRHIELTGIQHCLRVKFSDYGYLSAEDFFCNVLLGQLNARVITCGPDYRFGRGASADVNVLRELCKKHKVTLKVLSERHYKGEKISSTRIRQALKDGKISTVNTMLGHHYSIDFKVERGYGLGKKLGFPTTNQYWPSHFVVPKQGVYITAAVLDGKFLPSATGVTARPTFTQEDGISCETTISGDLPDMYGEHLTVQFYSYLFPPKRYENIEDLYNMVRSSVARSEEYFK